MLTEDMYKQYESGKGAWKIIFYDVHFMSLENGPLRSVYLSVRWPRLVRLRATNQFRERDLNERNIYGHKGT